MAEAVCERKKRKTKVKKLKKKELFPEENYPVDFEEKDVSTVKTFTERTLSNITSTNPHEVSKEKTKVEPTDENDITAKIGKLSFEPDPEIKKDAPSSSEHSKPIPSSVSAELQEMKSKVANYSKLQEAETVEEMHTEHTGQKSAAKCDFSDKEGDAKTLLTVDTLTDANSVQESSAEKVTGQKLYPDLTDQIADLIQSLEKAEEQSKLSKAKQEISATSIDEEGDDSKPVKTIEIEHTMEESLVSDSSSVYITPAEDQDLLSPKEQTETVEQHLDTAQAERADVDIDAVAETVDSQVQDISIETVDSAHPIETAVASASQVIEQPEASHTPLPEGATAPPSEDVAEFSPPAPEVLEQKKQHQALTLEQLNSLYYNSQLAQNPAFIDRFVQHEMKRDGHEFYEILLNYQRARRNLLQCESAVDSLESTYAELQDEVWITTKQSVTTKGTCGDGAKCTATHTYEQCQLNQTAMSSMKKTMDGIQDQLQNQLSLHSYSDQLSRLQVESYIHNLLMTSPVLRNVPQYSPVYGCERSSSDVSHQVSKLKDCITILFSFHRLPTSDDALSKHLQGWTQRLVSVLLRVGTLEDHLFVLNHVIRCPAGVGAWASELIQVPAIPSNQDQEPLSFGNVYLDHAMTCLATLLIPAIGREEFLCQMKKCFTPLDGNKKEIAWIMVDSDGEEDEDPQHAWLYLHENDVVAVLKQLHIADIFKHILFVNEGQVRDSYEYDVQKTSETTMYRVFAFCTCMVRVLGCGLSTYNMGRYRQLNKRLGRSIRQTVQYVSDHWENFSNHNQGIIPPERLSKLQAEFDAFFMRGVNSIHMAQRLGSWQFIANMPFSNISKATMWQLLWLLHQNHGESIDMSSVPSVQECKRYIQDPSSKGQLADILQRVPVSEGIYLLNSMTNMTACCTAADADFILTVTMSVFEVAYLCPNTRELWSKMGRELLASVVVSHPFMLSLLTQKVHEYMDKLGVMALYLYKGLPLDAWLPGDPDLTIVRQWLQTSELGQSTNQLAQVILGNINWGTSHRGDRLMVPWRVHKQVAVLVVEAYQRFILGKNLGSVIMEGVKQMTAVVHQTPTSEQEFNTWCWDLLLKLSLHRACLPKDDQRLAKALGDPPDLHKDDSLLPLVKGVKERNPAACCVVLMLTNYGHNIEDFMMEGVPLLQVMADQGLFKAVICVLNYTLPMFVGKHRYLLESDKFLGILHMILQADESYFKVVKGFLSYDFPGPITKLLISMVQSLASDSSNIDAEYVTDILCLVTKLILRLPKWNQDRNCCCVLDFVIEAGFLYTHPLNAIQQIILEEYQHFCQQAKQQGVVSSIVNWVTSGVSLPTFMEKSSFPEFSWLAYVLLNIEGQVEKKLRLWSSVQEEMLANQKMSPDQAVKKCITHLKLEQAPSYKCLNIYRWSQQAVDMPESHPASALIWHRFFVLFLGRLETPASLPQRASVGERFFSSMGYFSVLKKMKKKLGKIVDYHLKQSTDTPTDEQMEEVNNIDPVEDARKQFHCKVARLFQTFQLWLEEPRLHDATLYLPSLPPQYEADKLLLIFQNQTAPWLDFVDLKAVEERLKVMSSDWKTSSTPEQNPRAADSSTKATETARAETAADRIIARLKCHDKPLPPPDVPPLVPPVPEISVKIIEDRAAILHLLQTDLNRLREFAEKFVSRMAQHATLDHLYLEFVPYLFKNLEKQVIVSLQCTSMINPIHKCSSPGSATVKIEEKQEDPIIQRQAAENRAEFKQLMIEGRLPPPKPVVICAVHTENAITMLVKLFQSSTDETRRQHLNQIACRLFFYLGETINTSIQDYPPTKQFFASCLDVLGQEFIQKDGSQTEQVLKMALERPELAGLMSPQFVPGVSPRLFVSMYERLMKTLQGGNPGLTFTMLTKFNVRGWLQEYKPPMSEVKQFVDVLLQALMSCGAEPDDRHQMVFEVYIRHEKILLSHDFPCYLNVILAALLQGSAAQKLNVACWEILHNQCFYGNKDGEQIAQGPVDSGVQCVYTDLSTEQVRNLLHYMGQQMLQARTSQKEALTFGLYARWKMYVPYISVYLRDLAICLVDKMMPSLTETPSSEVVESVWHQVVEAFVPWIQALYSPVSMPWIEPDKDHASHMVRALRQVVFFAHNRTQDIRGGFYNDFMTLLWLYFSSVLCKAEVTNDVVAIYNLEFSQLPWQQLRPNMAVMETMAQMKEFGSGLGFNLVADIMSVIDWSEAMNVCKMYYPPEQKMRFQGCLFLLFIQAFAEGKHIENPDMQCLLTQAETYSWQYLTSEAFRSSCAWFMQGCDPKCLLVERTSPDAIGLRILKSASGFSVESSAVWSEEVSVRRLNYLHCVCQLVCQCTYLADCDTNSLSTFLINLLTEIETVESAVLDLGVQQDETVNMVKEIFSLLNNSNPEDNSIQVVMAAIVSWLQGSPQTALLLPCVHTATRSLACLPHMIHIVEECIQLYFCSGRQIPDDPWGPLLAHLQIPELNVTEFFQACLQEGGYLVLYCFILQRIPFCQRPTDQQGLIQLILDWTEKAKPSAEQESRLILWWYIMIDMLLKQLDYGSPPGICISLIRKLIHLLHGLGEERASTGLLGAIGLGKKSVLTDKFRLSCRALAAFCSSQILNESKLRFSPSDPESSPSKQELSNLLSLRNNKKYQPIRAEIDFICAFVQDKEKCFRDVLSLIQLLVERLYADKPYLSVIKA